MSSYLIGAIIVIALYTFLNLYVGMGKAYSKTEVSTARGYFIGNGMGMFVIYFTTMASFFSAWVFMGAPASYYQYGVGWLASMAWMLLNVWYMSKFGPKLWKMSQTKQYITPAELVSDYYNSKWIKYVIAIFLLIYSVPNIIAQMSAIGNAFSTMSEGVFPYWIGVVYCALVVGLYVFFGGFKSQAWVDTAQGILFVIVLWVAVIVMYFGCGYNGFGEMFNALNESSHQLLVFSNEGSWPFSKWLSYTLVMGTGGYFAPYVWQRMYAAKSGKMVTKMAGSLGFMYAIVVVLPICLCGLGAAVLVPDLANADSVIVSAMTKYAPLMSLFVVIAIIAAAMSTVSSILVSCSSMLAMDIFKTVKPEADTVKCRNAGRWFVVLIILVSMIMAFSNSSGIALLVNTSYAGYAQMLVPAFCIFYCKKGTKAGIFAGYIAGNIICLLLTAFAPWVYGFSAGVIGLASNVVITFVVSLVTKEEKEDYREKFLEPLRVKA